MNKVSVSNLKEIKKGETNHIVLDVRTTEEFEFSNIGGVNIPLDELEQRYLELDKDKTIYCLCHHGVRSFHAASFLASVGFDQTVNIEGGIDAWSLEIDSKVKRY